MTEQSLPPPVMWAQRTAVIFLTINLEDVKDPEIKFEKDSVYFKGTGGLEKKTYEVTIPLYKEIDPEKSKSFPRGRCIELLLAKANAEEAYWPALTKDKQKFHWLKCDFNKWHDEDGSDDEGLGSMGAGGLGDTSFNEMMKQMGGIGGPGGKKPSFDDLDDGDEADSDDEPIPDLE